MMPWPFVARSAYVAVCGERDRLAAELAQERERLDRALDHVRRLDRVRRKLPETPAAPKVPDAPLPQVAVEYLEGWAKNSPARAAVERDLRARLRSVGPEQLAQQIAEMLEERHV